MNTLEALNWRYATKKFNNKKLSSEQINLLKEAVKLSASSFGLEPYTIINVEDAETRKKLIEHSYGQDKVLHSSHLWVFAVPTNLSNATVDEYMKRISSVRGVPVEALSGFANSIKGLVQYLDDSAKIAWASKQAYIALGNLLTVAALEKIDACPMEGFIPAAYDQVLGLSAKNLKSVAVVALGFRAEDDETQKYAKVRKSTEELYITV